MRRTTSVLAVLLGGQLVLVAGAWLGAGQADGPQPEPLLTLDKESIETLRLAKGGDDQGVLLERSEAGWRLPTSDDYPAKAGKVENLVNELTGIEPGLPVASSSAAHSRFDLAAGNAQRRIVINEGQSDSVTLLIGKSAGTGRVYARGADGEAVHEIGFASWQAEPEPANWFATDKLQVPMTDVARVELPDFELVNEEKGGWSLAGAEVSGDISITKIKEFVAKAAQPTFKAVTEGSAPKGEPAVGYTVVTQEGSEHRFSYYAPDNDGMPLLARGGQDWRYRVGSELFNAVRDVEPTRFVASDEAAGKGDGETGSSAGSLQQ